VTIDEKFLVKGNCGYRNFIVVKIKIFYILILTAVYMINSLIIYIYI